MKYSFKELVDIETLQTLTDDLYEATSIPSAIIAMDGEILTGSGWQRICTDFHRQNPEMEKDCIKSDIHIREEIAKGESFSMYKCPRGLVDASSPVIIDGEHVANVFAGQLFLEPPDDETEKIFREQAKKYGLDEEKYIEAYHEIPVFTKSKLENILSFLSNFAKLVASIGLSRLNEKKASDALQYSEEKYGKLFENMTSGIALHEIILDKNGEPVDYIFLNINPSFEKLTGLKKESTVGKRILEIMPDIEPVFIQNYGNVALGGEPIKFEQYAEELNKHYQITSYCPEKGKFAVIFEDITERKIAEQELNDFVFTVSHDLKAPLRKLDGFAKLLETEYIENLDDEAIHYLERITDNTGQMKQLIDDLLELSRIGRTSLDTQQINLFEVAESVKNDFDDIIASKNAEVKISKDLPVIHANKTRVSQILSNLLGNSLKFSRENTHPEIEIGYIAKTREACIYVKDNGIGIESDYYDKIFGIFQRLHHKEEYEGTGVGLTIVKRIVESFGGRAWVESDFGKGATFYFTIPN